MPPAKFRLFYVFFTFGHHNAFVMTYSRCTPLLCCLFLGFNLTFLSGQTTSLVDLANPLMGTDSEFKLSNGNTYPAIAVPWGMNFWSPMTSDHKNGWFYAYDAYQINGIRQTHQPSPWIGDYAAFSLMEATSSVLTVEFKINFIVTWKSNNKDRSIELLTYRLSPVGI